MEGEIVCEKLCLYSKMEMSCMERQSNKHRRMTCASNWWSASAMLQNPTGPRTPSPNVWGNRRKILNLSNSADRNESYETARQDPGGTNAVLGKA